LAGKEEFFNVRQNSFSLPKRVLKNSIIFVQEQAISVSGDPFYKQLGIWQAKKEGYSFKKEA